MARKKRSNVTFGISLEPTWKINQTLEFAMLAEKLGFSAVWVPDGGPMAPYSDAIVTLSAIASRTKKIRLASAVLNFYTRNPAWIASSFLAISDLASRGTANVPQRVVLGLGVGASYNVAKFGVGKRSGLVENLREAVESIRDLLSGKEVTVRTDAFAIERVSLSKSSKSIPIHIGAGGPKGLRLAGEISDGVILTDRVASDIDESMKHIVLGLSDAARSRSELEITNSVVISIDEDVRKARRAAKLTCAYLVSWMNDEKARTLGIDTEARGKIARFIESGDEDSAAKLVDENMLTILTISGDYQDCVEGCRDHISRGIDHIAFCEPLGPNPIKSIEMIARKVLPRL